MNETHIELLIERAIDGVISDREWAELESFAEREPSFWRHLAHVHRDHAAMTAGMDVALATADAAEWGQVTAARQPSQPHHAQFNRFGAWTGWAVAAVVAIAAGAQWLQQSQTTINPIPATGYTAGLPLQTAAEAFQAYLDKGRETGEVVGEMPTRLLLDTKPAETGPGYEVIYVRQVMERAIVPDLYRVTGRDDAGRPTLVRYQHALANTM